jgi:hypothetical protein
MMIKKWIILIIILLTSGSVYADINWKLWQTKLMLNKKQMKEIRVILKGLPSEMRPFRVAEQEARKEVQKQITSKKINKSVLKRAQKKLVKSLSDQQELLTDHFIELRDVLKGKQIKLAATIHPFDLIDPAKVIVPPKSEGEPHKHKKK